MLTKKFFAKIFKYFPRSEKICRTWLHHRRKKLAPVLLFEEPCSETQLEQVQHSVSAQKLYKIFQNYQKI